MKISLGALEPPLTEQLAGVLPDKTLEIYERDAAAISRIHVRGIITNAQCDQAREKLIKHIQTSVKSLPPQPAASEQEAA